MILGGGRKYMFPKNTSDVEYPQEERHRGTRLDGKDLVQAWHDTKPAGKVGWGARRPRVGDGGLSPWGGDPVWPQQVAKYVWHRRELLALNVSRVDFLLGEWPLVPHGHVDTPRAQ